MPRPLAWVLAIASLSTGCAPSLQILAGRAAHEPLRLDARLAGGAEISKLTLSVDNDGRAPVGIELDALALRGVGDEQRPLGRPQRFRSAGGAEQVRRVPYGSLVVEPAGHAEVEVEMPPLRRGAGKRVVTLPRVFRLGIDGQVMLAPAEVQLVVDATATAAAEKQAFYDPFEE
jgi:hypothetical protein